MSTLTLDDYCDAALKNQGLRSDRQLSLHLGLNPGAVHVFRSKRAWPSDATMVSLARMAGQPAEQALLDLSAWRSEGEARVVWERISHKLAGTAAAVIVALGVGHLYAPDAKAESAPALSSQSATALYYGKFLWQTLVLYGAPVEAGCLEDHQETTVATQLKLQLNRRRNARSYLSKPIFFSLLGRCVNAEPKERHLGNSNNHTIRCRACPIRRPTPSG